MNTKIKQTKRIACLFAIGGILYVLIEVLWRGYSHPSMFFVGGVSFLLIGGINNWISWNMQIITQLLIGIVFVTVVEFITGCILNLCLKLHVWDYSDIPLNLLGQICLPYILLWVPLIIVAIVLDDLLRYKVFNEQRPHYRLGKLVIIIG